MELASGCAEGLLDTIPHGLRQAMAPKSYIFNCMINKEMTPLLCFALLSRKKDTNDPTKGEGRINK